MGLISITKTFGKEIVGRPVFIPISAIFTKMRKRMVQMILIIRICPHLENEYYNSM